MEFVYSPFSPESRTDPFSLYRRLRAEAPVCWTDDPGAFAISRFDDVSRVLTRADLFSSDAMGSVMMGIPPGAAADPAAHPEALAAMLAFARAMPYETAQLARTRTLITTDPPDHDALRRIVNRAFSPRRIAGWEPRLRELVAGCMAKLRAGEPFDVIRDLAVPVPVTIIAEMLGIDPERHADFKRWSDEIIAGTSGSKRHLGFTGSGVIEAMGEFAVYLKEIAERRRREPRDDMVSVLVDGAAHTETLSPAELTTFALVLLVAGNETTTNLTGNAVNALLEYPDQLERVRADASLVPNLVEEVLRYEGPVQFLFRRATRDVEIAGATLAKDSIVVALLGSANRDERRWGADAERLDVLRDTRGHLGFGFGVHFCLGAALARLEARCMLEALVPELPARTRREPSIEYIDSTLMRGPRRLELV